MSDTAAQQSEVAMLDLTRLDLAMAQRLLPHGEPLQVISEVLEASNQRILCRSVSQPPVSMRLYQQPLHTETESAAEQPVALSLLSCTEYVAQAASLGRILVCMASGDSRPRQGAVIRVRNWSFTRPTLECPCEMLVEAQWSSSVSGAYEVRGSVRTAAETQDLPAGELLAEGRLMIVEY